MLYGHFKSMGSPKGAHQLTQLVSAEHQIEGNDASGFVAHLSDYSIPSPLSEMVPDWSSVVEGELSQYILFKKDKTCSLRRDVVVERLDLGPDEPPVIKVKVGDGAERMTTGLERRFLERHYGK